MKEALRVAVTGAAGQIGYSLVFRIAAGDMLGTDQPIILQLLDLPQSQDALRAVAMELNDCAFPLLQNVIVTDNPEIAFQDADIALLVGARPRSKGMERKDLLTANAEIFSVQGKALNKVAKRDVKILVVGNPANTNALITQRNAPDLEPRNIHAMVRLDHNRAMYQLAEKTGALTSEVKNVFIWGNHSSTQYPDVYQAMVKDQKATDLIDEEWVEKEFIPTVQQRGSAVIAARGASSAASAANAAIDHVRDWVLGSKDIVSMAVPSDGSYDIKEGVVFGFPCRCNGNGEYEIVQDYELNDFSREKILASEKELREERAAVEGLL